MESHCFSKLFVNRLKQEEKVKSKCWKKTQIHVSKVSSNYFTAPVFIFHFLLKTCLVLSADVETRVTLWFCLKVHILPMTGCFFFFFFSSCFLGVSCSLSIHKSDLIYIL